jgi:hypothetical protein
MLKHETKRTDQAGLPPQMKFAHICLYPLDWKITSLAAASSRPIASSAPSRYQAIPFSSTALTSISAISASPAPPLKIHQFNN